MELWKRLYDRAIEAIGLGQGTIPADGASPIQNVGVLFRSTGGRRNGIPFLQHYGFASRPHAGCDYAVLALGGDPSKSVAVASNDQRYRVALAEGEIAIHDDQGQVVHLARGGITALDKSGNSIVTSSSGTIVTDASGSTITMAGGGILLAPNNKVVTVAGEIDAQGNAGTGMAVDGDLNVTGNIHATGDIVAGFGGAGPISLLGHLHGGVASGSSDTGAPIGGT